MEVHAVAVRRGSNEINHKHISTINSLTLISNRLTYTVLLIPSVLLMIYEGEMAMNNAKIGTAYFWLGFLGIISCLPKTTNGQGVGIINVDSTTSYSMTISWIVNGTFSAYSVDVEYPSGDPAPGYPINTSDTSIELDHLFPATSYNITVSPGLGDEGSNANVQATTDDSLIMIRVISPDEVSVNYSLPDGVPADEMLASFGYVGDPALQQMSVTPNSNERIATATFSGFSPQVGPGDLLFSTFAFNSTPDDILNAVRFRQAPDPPQNVMVTRNSNTSVRVTFDLPATESYDGFKIRIDNMLHTTLIGNSTTSVVIDGLDANTPYTFNVTSYKGIGGDEAESTGTTIDRTLVPAPPANVSIVRLSPTNSTLMVTITPPSGGYDNFMVIYGTNKNGSDVVMSFTLTNEYTSFNVTGLVPFAEYTFNVTTTFMNLRSAVATASQFTALSPPSNLRVTSVDLTTISIEWDMVTDAEAYVATISPGGATERITNGTSYSFEGLTAGTEYTISLFSSRDGDSSFDSEDAVISSATVPTTAEAPGDDTTGPAKPPSPAIDVGHIAAITIGIILALLVIFGVYKLIKKKAF